MRSSVSTNYLSFEINDIKENLASSQRSEKQQALLAIYYKKPHQSVELLKEQIKREADPIIKEIAIVVLSEFNFDDFGKFFRNIAKTYRESSNFVKARALWALGKKALKEDISLFVNSLDHENHEIQFWSIHSLAQFPPEELLLIDLEKALLKDNIEMIKNKIAWMFGINKFGNSSKVLVDALLKESNPNVRLNCVWAITRIGKGITVQALNHALKNELNSLVKRELAISIGTLLEANESKKTSIRSNIEENLILECIRTLSMVLQRDSTYFVRRVCAEALGKIKHVSAAEVLINHMVSEVNQFVRREIAFALGEIGVKKAVPVLQKARRSHYKMVAKAAAEAIIKIKKINKIV